MPKPVSETLIAAFHKGVLYSLMRSDTHSFSYFGGPAPGKVRGMKRDAAPLHCLGCLALGDVGVRNIGMPMPLYYGLAYSGCELKYQWDSMSDIDVSALQPKQATKDWPYRDYPRLLPYIPLQITSKRRMKYAVFANAIPNLPEEQSAELIVVIPPPASVGVSLWGSMEDAEEVTIVLECDVEANTVRAFNCCT